MKIRFLLPIILFIVSPFALANMHGSCPCMEKMAQQLNLTADQKQKIEQIKAQAHDQMQGDKKEMQSLKSEMQELVKSEKLDDTKLDAFVNQKKELMAHMMKAKIKMKNQIYNVLDAQQKTKFMEMMDKKMEKHTMSNDKGDAHPMEEND